MSKIFHLLSLCSIALTILILFILTVVFVSNVKLPKSFEEIRANRAKQIQKAQEEAAKRNKSSGTVRKKDKPGADATISMMNAMGISHGMRAPEFSNHQFDMDQNRDSQVMDDTKIFIKQDSEKEIN